MRQHEDPATSSCIDAGAARAPTAGTPSAHRSTEACDTLLDRYVHRDDPSFRWDTAAVQESSDGTLFDLRLVSQQWQGIEWKHHLLVFAPKGSSDPDLALLVLRNGVPEDPDAGALRTISRETGTAAAFLFELPNQPLFEGREEDELLAHTFSQFLRTGDESWPLFFPMVTSVVRAMDAIQAVTAVADHHAVHRFVVAGHSKRGQTAWLSGVADPRVQGIIALAIDVLNSHAQIDHQLEVAGEISASSRVFEETIEAADSPRGRSLIRMIDPYTYRARLVQPKLVVLGTNDDYTPPDALNLYWDGLPGPKSVLYLPNTTHAGVNSHADVNPAAFAFVRSVAAGTALPELDWVLERRGSAAELKVTAKAPVRSARVWSSTSATRDFRASQWSRSSLLASRGGATSNLETFTGEISLPAGAGYTAVFGEVELLIDGKPFKLSTQIQVIENEPTWEAGPR